MKYHTINTPLQPLFWASYRSVDTISEGPPIALLVIRSFLFSRGNRHLHSSTLSIMAFNIYIKEITVQFF